MVPVLVSHHVLLSQRAAAGTELRLEHLEEIGVEVRGVVGRAVKRADFAAGRTAAGLDLALEQFHRRPLVTAQQLLPDAVDGVAGGHHPALVIFVGVRTRPAFAQVVGRPGLRRRPDLLLADHWSGIHAQEQRQQHDRQAAEPPADRDAPSGAASG